MFCDHVYEVIGSEICPKCNKIMDNTILYNTHINIDESTLHIKKRT